MDPTHVLVIPANTAEADAIEEDLELFYGAVRRVQILVPPGHAGLAHLQIYYQARQVWPFTFGETFSGDDTFYDFEENYPIKEEPYAVTLRGWNSDTTYEHRFIVKLVMPPPEILMPIILMPPELPEGIG